MKVKGSVPGLFFLDGQLHKAVFVKNHKCLVDFIGKADDPALFPDAGAAHGSQLVIDLAL